MVKKNVLSPSLDTSLSFVLNGSPGSVVSSGVFEVDLVGETVADLRSFSSFDLSRTDVGFATDPTTNSGIDLGMIVWDTSGFRRNGGHIIASDEEDAKQKQKDRKS